jgi:hypothetical protein
MPDAQVQIGQVTLTTAQTAVVFTNLTQSYRDLILVVTLQNSTVSAYPSLRFNGDATSGNYSRVGLRGNGTSATGFYVTPETALFTDGPSSGEYVVFRVMDYSASDKHKTVITHSHSVTDSENLTVGRWASTSSVTSLSVTTTNTDTYGIGSTFILYGVLA